MKNFIILIILFLGIRSTAYCQNNNAIARIRYQEAEELYEKGSYELSLKKLEQVESLLNSSNSKILYLKILIEDTLYKIDRRQKIPSFKSTNSIQNDLKYFISNYYSVSDEKLSQVLNMSSYYDTIPYDFVRYKEWYQNRLNYWTNKLSIEENNLQYKKERVLVLEDDIKRIVKKERRKNVRTAMIGFSMWLPLITAGIYVDVKDVELRDEVWGLTGTVGFFGLITYIRGISNDIHNNNNGYADHIGEQRQMIVDLNAEISKSENYIIWIKNILDKSHL
jgi:hypothetical protein